MPKKINIGDEWELDDNKRPTGRLLPIKPEIKKLTFDSIYANDQPISVHTTIVANDQRTKSDYGAMISSEDRKYKIIYELSESYKHWMIYNGRGNEGYICIEPQTWMINAPNMERVGVKDSGLIEILPGAARTDSTRIYIIEK